MFNASAIIQVPKKGSILPSTLAVQHAATLRLAGGRFFSGRDSHMRLALDVRKW
jgi:hypothetical protein